MENNSSPSFSKKSINEQALHSQSTREHSSTPNSSDSEFIAYCVRPNNLRIQVAPVDRMWMNLTPHGFANRCLPLRIANQAGWFILNDRSIQAIWNGGPNVSDVVIYQDKREQENLAVQEPSCAISHFGCGIVTWRIPYLFRTPPGYNLIVRGPTNWCKDGVCPLDGVVETDWAVATFTMNWKITRTNVPVSFEKGEPICMVFPQRRGELEGFRPELRNLAACAEIKGSYEHWERSREAFLKVRRNSKDEREKRLVWQKHYYIGQSTEGADFSSHQLRLHLVDFDDRRE